ncbi:unnamed protein product [Boreogadus saida]
MKKARADVISTVHIDERSVPEPMISARIDRTSGDILMCPVVTSKTIILYTQLKVFKYLQFTVGRYRQHRPKLLNGTSLPDCLPKKHKARVEDLLRRTELQESSLKAGRQTDTQEDRQADRQPRGTPALFFESGDNSGKCSAP